MYINNREKYKVKRYRTLLKTLIAIAEAGNDYIGLKDEDDCLEVGAMIADIQNSLGENQDLLEKLGLHYNPEC